MKQINSVNNILRNFTSKLIIKLSSFIKIVHLNSCLLINRQKQMTFFKPTVIINLCYIQMKNYYNDSEYSFSESPPQSQVSNNQIKTSKVSDSLASLQELSPMEHFDSDSLVFDDFESQKVIENNAEVIQIQNSSQDQIMVAIPTKQSIESRISNNSQQLKNTLKDQIIQHLQRQKRKTNRQCRQVPQFKRQMKAKTKNVDKDIIIPQQKLIKLDQD